MDETARGINVCGSGSGLDFLGGLLFGGSSVLITLTMHLQWLSDKYINLPVKWIWIKVSIKDTLLVMLQIDKPHNNLEKCVIIRIEFNHR